METAIVSLVSLGIGSALVPVQVIIAILLLKSPRQGLLKASAYVSGMTIMRLLQGFLFGLVLTAEAGSAQTGGGKGPIVSTLLLLLGIFLLITAYKKWRKEEDADDPPPKWLTMIDSLTPLKAFGIGLGIVFLSPKLWVFTLSAGAAIAQAQLGQSSSIIAFLLYVLLAQSTILLPILFRIILPKRARGALERFSDWLTCYNRAIVILVSLVFGLFFLYQGVSGFLP